MSLIKTFLQGRKSITKSLEYLKEARQPDALVMVGSVVDQAAVDCCFHYIYKPDLAEQLSCEPNPCILFYFIF